MTRAGAGETALRRAVLLVAGLNLADFGVEFAVALSIGSVALFADSADFLEDTAVNLLIALALSWTAARRARLGMGLALILLVPGIATLWTAIGKVMALWQPWGRWRSIWYAPRSSPAFGTVRAA